MSSSTAARTTIFVCGDVMLGRGIDQILPHPSVPLLYEPYVKDARDYVRLAEAVHGPLPRQAPLDYVWGEALEELARVRPQARIINLETSITRSDAPWPDKSIHYRMHPAHVGCLSLAQIDICALANNHVLDWGEAGLRETLATLQHAGVGVAGAGLDREGAWTPAVKHLPHGARLWVWSVGTESSGISSDWAAGAARPGLAVVDEHDWSWVAQLAERIAASKQPGDLVVLSIHWGGNWGHAISAAHQALAHALIDEAGVDLVHGHSSHHVKGFEVYRNKLILYGCGDFLQDYEGIAGYEPFRADLGLMYFPTLDARGELVELRMTPTRVERFRVKRATAAEARWLRETLNREGQRFGSHVDFSEPSRLSLRWNQASRS